MKRIGVIANCDKPDAASVLRRLSDQARERDMNLVTTGAIMGGNVRVGLEDNLYIAKGEMAQSNAQQVTKIRGLLRELSLEIATPAEVRELLALKGAERVQF